MKASLLISAFIVLMISENSFSFDTKYTNKLLKNNKHEELATYLSNKEFPLSSFIITLDELEETNMGRGQMNALHERNFRSVGSSIYKLLSFNLLKKIKTASVDFIQAVKLYEFKKYNKALKVFKQIDSNNQYYAESLYYIGSIELLFNSKIKKSKKNYMDCETIANDRIQSSGKRLIQNYYQLIKDKCIFNLARVFYQTFEYKKALQYYNQIDKKSLLWPHTLVEKAWTNFNLDNLNRTLGLVVTYKSPLLASYFLPESEILMARSYYELCLWDDTNRVITNYYQKYKKQSEVLTPIINRELKSESFFYQLYYTKKHSLEQYNFVKNIKVQLRKNLNINLNSNAIKNIENELKKLSTINSSLSEYLTNELIKLKVQLILSSNNTIKKYMVHYINTIYELSLEMFNIKLNIISKEKDLIYSRNTLISDRARGSFKNIRRENSQHFYKFNGSFWADELGDYSFGLRNNCKKVKKNKQLNKVVRNE